MIKTSLTDQCIIDSLNINYRIPVAKLLLLPIGADINASVYKVEADDGTSFFVKLKRGHHDDISVVLLALLQRAGIQQIIPPIKTIDGKLTQQISDFTITVYPFISGQNGFQLNLTDDQWMTLGKVLRQVHEIDVPASIKNKIRKENYSSQHRDAVRSFDAYLDEYITKDKIALQLQKFMKDHRMIIRRLVERAEDLSQKIRGQTTELVLCHSDIHGGNVLIDEYGAIYIVDWDAPMIAPRERDLMFVGGGVANVWNHPREEGFFYKGYGKININRSILSYYRYERIVEDIAEYVQALLLTSDAGEDRLEMFQQFIDMFEPNGVVDIAIKTDEDKL